VTTYPYALAMKQFLLHTIHGMPYPHPLSLPLCFTTGSLPFFSEAEFLLAALDFLSRKGGWKAVLGQTPRNAQVTQG